MTVATSAVTITNELPGRLSALRVAEVRARVPGVILERVFNEGSDVKAGDILFRIDPAPFQVDVDSARAALAKADANAFKARLLAGRYKDLVAVNAVSKQEYDEAVSSLKQAQADVASAKASLERAELNLGYATVRAPISGRIGRALVTEGALVGENEATPLATIQQLDSVYADFTQSVSDLMALKKAFAAGKMKAVAPGAAMVTLRFDDGTDYAHPGKMLFSDITVDESTGEVTLRAAFPNPEEQLLPGMYVRVRLEQGIDNNAILLPQQAVQYGVGGTSHVLVVDAKNKIETRPVKIGRAYGNNWIITGGLRPGERVIVEGFQQAAMPDAQIIPMPWKPDAADGEAVQPSENK
jgi:membrane fusion protein (multidrug efflux system)